MFYRFILICDSNEWFDAINDHSIAIKKNERRISANSLIVNYDDVCEKSTRQGPRQMSAEQSYCWSESHIRPYGLYHDGFCVGCLKLYIFKDSVIIPIGNLLALKAIGAFSSLLPEFWIRERWFYLPDIPRAVNWHM